MGTDSRTPSPHCAREKKINYVVKQYGCRAEALEFHENEIKYPNNDSGGKGNDRWDSLTNTVRGWR